MNKKDINTDIISKDILVTLLKKVIEIRRFEEKAIQLYQKNKLYGQLHPYLGAEAIAAGACTALRKEDYILSTHRGHGHCIARGSDLNKMMAELFGKATGYCNGKGGSMHISDPELNILGATGIVGGGLPLSVGVGFSSRIKGNNCVTICFFGDGATNTGVFHESLNMAAVFKLPVVYICENNMYAVSTHVQKSTSCKNIADRSIAYNIPGYIIDGNNPVEVYKTVKKAVKYARDAKGPSLIEAKTLRYTGHHLNDAEAYRDKEEVKIFKMKNDPVNNYITRLLGENIIDKTELVKIEEDIKKRIEEAVVFATNSPEPSIEEFIEEINQL